MCHRFDRYLSLSFAWSLVVCVCFRFARNSPRSAASDLCRQTAGGWTYPVRLQHPKRLALYAYVYYLHVRYHSRSSYKHVCTLHVRAHLLCFRKIFIPQICFHAYHNCKCHWGSFSLETIFLNFKFASGSGKHVTSWYTVSENDLYGWRVWHAVWRVYIEIRT